MTTQGTPTPSPWFWALDKDNRPTSLMRSGTGDYILSPQSDLSDYGLSCHSWTDISDVDAALIAAAPALLEAARALIQCDDARSDVQPLFENACKLARAGVAIAEGGGS
jgi:hypothetical protein